MKFNLLVTGDAYSSQSGYSALQFCYAAVAAEHTITQIFFYQNGVTQASALAVPSADEFEPVSAWVDFANEHGVELVVCVSAGERRGIIGPAQAKEFGKPSSNLHAAFTVAGLGVLHEASLASDRTVSFK